MTRALDSPQCGLDLTLGLSVISGLSLFLVLTLLPLFMMSPVFPTAWYKVHVVMQCTSVVCYGISLVPLVTCIFMVYRLAERSQLTSGLFHVIPLKSATSLPPTGI